MLLPTTEMLPENTAIDALTMHDAAALMLRSQHAALNAVETASKSIEAGATAMATAIRNGHSLTYAAAGSSGLMALADASELSGTFGVPSSLVKVFMAGGVPVDGCMLGNTEDDTAGASAIVENLSSGDVIVVLSASGTTPYAVSVATAAKNTDATLIGIANNPDTDLLNLADIPICLETPPEVIAGSTRLGAGTAQKAALNLMSSLMGIKLGHVFQGLMVNVVADNAKLEKRVAGIVSQVANVSEAQAKMALNTTKGHAKSAILVASGCSTTTAQELLAAHQGHLGPCLHALHRNHKTNA